MKLSKIYEPKKVEDKIYKLWQKSGFFNPNNLPGKRKSSFCIVIPPPNITGELHMGHALNTVIQDILIRQKRMQGFSTLWLPGTDHAGIATQNVVEKELAKQGLTRQDLGRKKFLEKVWAWQEKYGNLILEQLKRLGCSCDWSRIRFTLDKAYIKAVQTAFIHYYKKGYIYRGPRIVNWCRRCSTAISDIEVKYRLEKGKLWYIRYKVKEYPKGSKQQKSKVNHIVVATTRPETMLGDTAVAVNPKDKRYRDLVGKKVMLPIMNREVPVIAHRLVDAKFGSGAVKITPAHDKTDWKIGKENKLEIINVIGPDGKMTERAGKYAGFGVLEARQKIVKELKGLGLLAKEEDYQYQISLCDRCSTPIEPQISTQWFLKMDKLVKPAIEAVKKKRIKIIPERYKKVYLDWLVNIEDWCISRQLWWGHKIPLKGANNVLDTWFSSALWPFATLGWPKKTKDLKRFYPADVLSTDRGIINLWVARMIFSGLEFMKKIPFKKVFIHPTVLTKEGKRMSKSLGTGVDPIKLIEKYGADATRFGISWKIGKLQDIRFVEDDVLMGKKFSNKIWNAARFVLEHIDGGPTSINSDLQKLPKTVADKRILKLLDRTTKSVNKDLDNFQFGKAAHTLYDFFWHDFCDRYIEISKSQIANRKSQKKTQKILFYVLLTSLKLLHPFVPFLSEEIYQKLPLRDRKKSLMVEEYPY